MIDFEKMFIDYARKNADPAKAGSSEVARLYDEWRDAPCAALKGQSPAAYLESVNDGTRLISFLRAGKSGLVMERIAAVPDCIPHLKALIEESEDDELTGVAIELLTELGGAEPLDTYISIIRLGGCDSALTELVIGRLKFNIAAVQERLLDEADNVTDHVRTLFAEILLNGKRNERTFKLLTDLFLTGKNYPLYADYLGKYGDERAVAFLYPALDKTDYADYTEIKNAIERLGGTVDEDLRDFTEDPVYRLIKNQH